MKFLPIKTRRFLHCLFYHNLSLSAIDAPDVKAIGAFAFGTCLSLRRIEAPRVLYIDTCAFCRCEALTGVTFQSVIEIGEAVFCECLSLTYADMPLLQKIPFRTFDHCVSLLCADYPRVLSVGGLAFSECRCLQSFHMPLVQEIGDRAFAGTALCRFILPNWQANGLFALFAYSYNAVMGGPVPVIYAEATPENVQYAAALHFELRGVSEIADHSVVNDWVTVSGPLYLYDDTVLVAVTDPGTTLLLPRFALSSDTVWSTVLYENRLYQVKTIQLEKTTPCDYLRSRPIDEAEIKPICHDGYYGDFSYEAYDDYIKVTGYHGGSTDVFIPEFIDGKPVTILSQSLLGGVTIPEELFMSHAVTSVTARSVTAFDGGTELDADGAPRQSLFFFTTHWLTSLSFPMLKALPDDCWVGDCHLTVLDLSSCEAIADGCFINCQIDNLFLPAGSIFRQEAFRQCTVGRLTFKQP